MKVNVNGVDYEEASKLSSAYTEGLMRIYNKLGEPTDCSTNSGWIMLDNIMQVWDKAFPREKADWIKEIKEELTVERSIRASVKAGGYFPMSYPTRLYNMIHAILPNQKLNDKRFIREFINRYPFLKTTNYSV